MRFFIDTGSVAEVEEIAAWGVLSGATTNPSLLAKEEGDPGDAIKRICELVDGDVSAEVVSRDAASMIAEGRALRTLHDNVIVKVPFSAAGLEATRALTSEGHKVNMTLVFSSTQALLTAEAGAASDDLDGAVATFLALALVDVGSEREAVAVSLTAPSPTHNPTENTNLLTPI